MRPRLVFAHQPAKTGYIGMQDGSKFPFPRPGLENFDHRRQMMSRKLQLAHIVNAFDPTAGKAHHTAFG
jgi:hypothetical protein